MVMKKSLLPLFIFLLPLAAGAQTPYHDEDGQRSPQTTQIGTDYSLNLLIIKQNNPY